MEFYLIIEKKEMLPFVTTWMDLEGFMLSEVSQTEKDKYCIISLICGSKKTELTETENKLVVARGEEWKLGEIGEGGKKKKKKRKIMS